MVRRNIYLINMNTETGEAMTINGDFPSQWHTINDLTSDDELKDCILEDLFKLVKDASSVRFSLKLTCRDIRYIAGDYYEDCYIRVDLGNIAFVPLSDQELKGSYGKVIPKNLEKFIKGMLYHRGVICNDKLYEDESPSDENNFNDLNVLPGHK